MPATATLTKGPVLGDVFKALWHPGYCLQGLQFENHLGTSIDIHNACGMAVKIVGGKWRSVQAGDEANATGLLYFDKPLEVANGATHADKIPALVRGPALVNKDKVRATDSSGAAINVTTVMTALAALSPAIREVTEPTVTSTQTT